MNDTKLRILDAAERLFAQQGFDVSIRAITDEAGEVKERYGFSAFGIRRIMAPDFSVRSSSEVFQSPSPPKP